MKGADKFIVGKKEAVSQPMIPLSEWEAFFLRKNIPENQIKILLAYIRRLDSGGFPVIFEFEHLSRLLGYDSSVLARLTINPEKSYRSFSIPKKRGGVREINSPYPALAYCQRWVLENILSNIELGSHSYAFRKDRSIVDNARVHVGNEEILKLDLTDFFGSIKIERVISIFKNAGYTNSLSYHLASICCFRQTLPQGACTSPMLSNIVAKKLDVRLYSLVKNIGLYYSRYADDITISGNKIPRSIVSKIKEIVQDEGFDINDNKTVLKSKGQKKIVTGLCVTGNRVRVPKSYRRNFRQKSHYLVNLGLSLYRRDTGEFDPLFAYRLIGQANFILSVEPDNKYAAEMLAKLKEILPT